MKSTTFLITALILLLLIFNASAKQVSGELAFIISSNPLIKQKGHNSRIQANIFIRAIRFYQSFISTQDVPVCNFTPSCSQFGIESIRKFGIIRGILLTSDRLQRCNGMSISRYQLDHRTGKLIDPVSLYITKSQ